MKALLQTENKRKPLSEEKKKKEVRNMNKFTAEQREGLEKRGYSIFTLTGKSMQNLKKQGFKTWSTWHKDKSFEKISSLKSEVAVNLSYSIYPRSENKTYFEIEELVKSITKDLPKGTRGIIGSIADYMELWDIVKQKTGKPLLDWFYTWTSTQFGAGLRLIGGYSGRGGLADVNRLGSDGRNDDVGFRPLVVPDLESLNAKPLKNRTMEENIDRILEILEKYESIIHLKKATYHEIK